MKRSCKDIDITDWKTVVPWVLNCVLKHKSRRDFRNLICGIGKMEPADYWNAIEHCDKGAFEHPTENIAKEAVRRIKERSLELPPIRYRKRIDTSSGKERLIGKESAMQQILDHIAYGAAEPILKRRIVPQQASSIQGRGQLYGVHMIQRWAEKDCWAAEWAKQHSVRYSRRCKYVVKLDIRKCYPSMNLEIFMSLFRRDCGNADLLWLWETLLQSHQVGGYHGFMIGALPSQWAAQYMLSFLYRHAMNLHRIRRGRRQKLVSHMLLYMDDILLVGASRKNLITAIREITQYAYNVLGLSIKPDWAICRWQDTPVDMMGYVIRNDGTVTIRPRVFLRARRAALRYLRTRRMTIRQARRLCAYKGFFVPSLTRKYKIRLKIRRVMRRLRMKKIFGIAAKIISNQERRKSHDCNLLRKTGNGHVYATA